MSASSKTMTGALPPSSRWTRLSWSAPECATCMPARTEPVIATSCGIGCSTTSATGVAVTGDHVEHARGQELRGQLGEQRRGRRRGVAGLEDDAVARGQRRRDLPHHHHQRVVPRGHLADDADRLPAYERGVVLEVLPRRLALEHPGGAGEEADLVDRRRQLLVDGEPDRLAGVAGLDVDELARALLQRVGDLEQRQLALGRGGVAPGLERLVRGPVGAVDVLGARLGGRRVHLPGGRVDDVVGLPRRAVHQLAVDDVAEGRVSHESHPVRDCLCSGA